MDGDQQLNFYCCYPVALVNRFICQPKFAGKTYVKFEGQESTAIIWQISRLASKLHISRSASHRHAQSPMAAFILCWQFVLMHAFNFISHALWELQLSAICCINNKNSISYIFCILYILCIFIWQLLAPARSRRKRRRPVQMGSDLTRLEMLEMISYLFTKYEII